jgi:hypothetical protein
MAWGEEVTKDGVSLHGDNGDGVRMASDMTGLQSETAINADDDKRKGVQV